jgi:hypothetical protein
VSSDLHIRELIVPHLEYEFVVHLHDQSRRLLISHLRLHVMQRAHDATHRGLDQVGGTALTESVRYLPTLTGTSGRIVV